MTTEVSPTAYYRVYSEKFLNIAGTSIDDVQHVKLMLGANGANNGPVSATNPLPTTATGTTDVNILSPIYTEHTAVDDTTPGFFIGARDIAGDTWTALKAVKGGADIDSTTMQMCTAGATYGWTGTKFSPIFTGATGQELLVEVRTGSITANPPTFSSATTATLGVTTSSQTALASSGTRKFAFFQNDSDTTIYLKLGSSAAANSGIRLNANGGAYEINTNNLYTGIVTAIHGGTGTKTLLITSG